MARSIPQRVRRSDLNRGEEWDLDAIYEHETTRITRWLEESAALRSSNSEIGDEDVVEAGESYVQQLAGLFTVGPRHVDAKTVIAAEKGEIRQKAGSRAMVNVFRFATLLLFFAEFIIFLLQFLFGDLSFWGAIFQATLLSMSGFFLGYSAASLLGDPVESGDRGNSERRDRVFSYVGLVVSFGCIIVVALVRAGIAVGSVVSFEELLVGVGLTTAVALLLALSEASYRLASVRFERELAKQFICQQLRATELHRKDYEGGLWLAVYKNEVTSIRPRARAILRAPVGASDGA